MMFPKQTPSEDPESQIGHESRRCNFEDQIPSRVRRRSVDSITRERASRPRRRRPSEEALNISGEWIKHIFRAYCIFFPQGCGNKYEKYKSNIDLLS